MYQYITLCETFQYSSTIFLFRSQPFVAVLVLKNPPPQRRRYLIPALSPPFKSVFHIQISFLDIQFFSDIHSDLCVFVAGLSLKKFSFEIHRFIINLCRRSLLPPPPSPLNLSHAGSFGPVNTQRSLASLQGIRVH